MLVLCLGVLTLLEGCIFETKPAGTQKQVVLAGAAGQKLLPELVQAYNAGGHKYMFQYQPDSTKAFDCYLGTRNNLQVLVQQGKLAPLNMKDNVVPLSLKDEQGLWYGVFYDPVVFLVNHQFARKQGQEQVTDWYALPNLKNTRLIVENLNDSASTKDFLAALASHMGQEACLQYFQSLQPLLGTFGKFPITSIRMVAGGDADVALTRSSFVAPYLESNFPAYVQVPEGGTPVTLYAFGKAKDSQEQAAVADFLNWILTSEQAQQIIQPAGFYPLSAGNVQEISRKLWLNTFYKDTQAVDKLVDVWVKTIRLGTTTTEVKK